MNLDHHAKAAQMADESMPRNLAAQAEVVWPQELPPISRYQLGAAPGVLDLARGHGCAVWQLPLVSARVSG